MFVCTLLSYLYLQYNCWYIAAREKWRHEINNPWLSERDLIDRGLSVRLIFIDSPGEVL